MNFAVGKKLNMSQYFDEASGEVVPVSVLKAEKLFVTQVKEITAKDGYNAVQVGFGKKKKLSKALIGHFKGLGSFAQTSEFKVKTPGEYKIGQQLDLSAFQVGEMVNAIGVSKGRGFAGAMKRHGFSGFPMSHGHNKPRSVGSIGQRWPQHVRKGMRMAGHMGDKQVTVKNLQVVEVDLKRNLVMLKGAVPGTRNGFVRIISTGKVKPVVRMETVKEEKKKK